MDIRRADSTAPALAAHHEPTAFHPTSDALPVAVSQSIVDLVMGPMCRATVLAAYSAAVVLCIEPRRDEPAARRPPRLSSTEAHGAPARVITVLAREASGVPNGARTTLSAQDAPFSCLTDADGAFVGSGTIALPGLRLRVARTIRTGVPRIAAGRDAVDAVRTAAGTSSRGVPLEPVDEFRAALDAGDPARLRTSVRSLIGLGRGSTPGGDDVLCGTLAGLIATRRGVLADQIAAAALPDLASRTPLLSADLLRLAAAGHVCAEAAAVLRAVDACSIGHRSGQDALTSALAGLLAVGGTSGADLTTGLAIGLGVAPQPAPRRPRQSSRSSVAAGAR